jgi:UDP:flavonoid glycosyltransferase YjiC (YdhE family)
VGSKKASHDSNPDVSSLLPPGFEQRTEDRGLVVTSWAPQIAILAHPSTGAFLSHCGWNSVLESIWYGVPMIAWPLHADQKANAFFLVNDIKMAVGTEQRAGGIVTKEEVEKAAREVMEGEEGKKKRAESERIEGECQSKHLHLM